MCLHAQFLLLAFLFQQKPKPGLSFKVSSGLTICSSTAWHLKHIAKRFMIIYHFWHKGFI
ncbi:hypothetical protein AAZV13_08G307800 [Glycine max]